MQFRWVQCSCPSHSCIKHFYLDNFWFNSYCFIKDEKTKRANFYLAMHSQKVLSKVACPALATKSFVYSSNPKGDKNQRYFSNQHQQCSTRFAKKMRCHFFVLYNTIYLILVVLASKAQDFIECYECKSRGVSQRCADPFQLIGRDKYMSQCQSGWCLKIQVGLGGEDGVGYTERKCLLDSIPDGIERCSQANYKGQEALACFCRGHLCNQSYTISNSNFWTVLLSTLFLQSIK